MDSRRDMPEHLLFEILLWLPVTSLLLFKSVCKSWFTLIESPIFIFQHFDHNSGNDNLLGVCCKDDYEFKKLCVISNNKYEVINSFDCGQPWHVVKEAEQAFSSNGIVSLVDYNREEISLWNPAMKQLRSLPKSEVPCLDFDKSFFGFGFNVKSNDYNFVRTSRCNENNSKNLVEVYSLRADSWRSMHNDFAIPSRFFYKSYYDHITKDGTCFWVACSMGDDNSDGNIVLSFDLNEETYETMPLPVGEVNYVPVISFLDDKLAYIHGVDRCRFMNGHSYYEIWILQEYGVKESWNKAWKIGPTDVPGLNDVRFPLRFILNGQFLLLEEYGGIYSLYNLGSEENEYLELQCDFGFWWSVSYKESLFPVKRVNDAC